jgi:hypothetical protein
VDIWTLTFGCLSKHTKIEPASVLIMRHNSDGFLQFRVPAWRREHRRLQVLDHIGHFGVRIIYNELALLLILRIRENLPGRHPASVNQPWAVGVKVDREVYDFKGVAIHPY